MSLDLLIFATKGRHHILRETYSSFRRHCTINFDSIILSIAGYDPGYLGMIEEISPTVVFWDYNAPGYFKSACRAISEITAPFYVWLEDDWRFERDLPANEMLDALLGNEEICQVAIPSGINGHIGVLVGKVDWMVATCPHMGRTELFRKAFIGDGKKSDISHGGGNIESYLGRVMQGYSAGVLGSKDGRYMTHIGALYSCDRKLHDVGFSHNGCIAVCGSDSVNAKPPIIKNLRCKNWIFSYSFHIENITGFIVLFFNAILCYLFSKKQREFVTRVRQYHKNTP